MIEETRLLGSFTRMCAFFCLTHDSSDHIPEDEGPHEYPAENIERTGQASRDRVHVIVHKVPVVECEQLKQGDEC